MDFPGLGEFSSMIETLVKGVCVCFTLSCVIFYVIWILTPYLIYHLWIFSPFSKMQIKTTPHTHQNGYHQKQ